MFPNGDNGFEFFNGDIQDQYFNYFLYTEMMGDEPFGLFEDERYDDFSIYPNQYDPIDQADRSGTPANAQRYEDHQHRRQHRISSSLVMFYITVIFFAVLILILLIYKM